MIKKIAPGIWKLAFHSNIYIIEPGSLIDAGDRKDRQQVEAFLSKVVRPEEVKRVIFTHLHYDHIGNFDLFPNALFYASKKEIENLNKNPEGTILRKDIAEKFTVDLQPAESDDKLEIIETPGHSSGAICIWHAKERILFSGDTMFDRGLGRVDLPTSVPDEMQKTVMKLLKYNYRILCPGHDY